jgi:GH15 family glucan-1,4-alpha-glucosidase
MSDDRYPPIADYGFIADCHSSALVSRTGSIDWCCMPRMDDGSMFGRLLDWDRGGFCKIAPTGDFEIERRYLEGTLVLETTFRTEDGAFRLIDCFVMRKGGRDDPARQVVRVVEGVEGSVEVEVRVAPRFEYGVAIPWIRPYAGDHWCAFGGDDALVIAGDLPVELEDHLDLIGVLTVSEGDRYRMSLSHIQPEDADGGPEEVQEPDELDRRLDETVQWWRRWAERGRQGVGAGPEAVQRSALVLKGLTISRTGAITAAATTSLPEVVEGRQNWDYRFSWVRDSTWAVRTLYEMDHDKEAEGFRRFMERTVAGSLDDLNTIYGLGGEHFLFEAELEHLEGYRGARPVRIGNLAAFQQQHDIYGELLELAWEWYERGHRPDHHYWMFLRELANIASEVWRRPDRGIWELRQSPEHYVHSKAMCWAAVDHGIRLAAECDLDAPTERWEKARDEIRRVVEEHGYDEDRGVFVRILFGDELDGSLLLLPRVGFVDYEDERMVRTAEAIRKELDNDGLIMRFRSEKREGAFLPCSFWLAECLARQGKQDEAAEVFERACETANDLGLFSEEYDPSTDEMVGNFPQALTHLSHISAALALSGEPEAEA